MNVNSCSYQKISSLLEVDTHEITFSTMVLLDVDPILFKNVSIHDIHPTIIFNKDAASTTIFDKGSLLKEFCKKEKYVPKRILMIDSLKENIESVYKFASENHIPMTAYLVKKG